MATVARRHGEELSEKAELRAVRLIAITFLALAAGVGAESIRKLVVGAEPDESLVGIGWLPTPLSAGGGPTRSPGSESSTSQDAKALSTSAPTSSMIAAERAHGAMRETL